MKILHIDLCEYQSLEELHKAFWDMPEEMKDTGVQLASSKKQAISNLEYQYKHFRERGARVFWWAKEKRTDLVTGNELMSFVMYEAIYD